MDKQIRTPRPKGLTELSIHYNKEQTEETLHQLHIHTTNHYIDTGFMYCHQPMDLYAFSQMTGISISLIQQQMLQRATNSFSMVDKEEQQDHLRALTGTLLSFSLSDRNRALTQYETLSRAQGQTYKPFISGEVNKALKLTLDTTQNMTNLYKALMGNDGFSVIVNSGPTVQNNNYLTIDKALTVLQQNSPKALPLGQPNPLNDILYQEHGIGDTPEVVATRQQGINTDKEGLGFAKLAKLSDGKVDQIIMPEDGREVHTDRRAKSLNIDLEDDDNI